MTPEKTRELLEILDLIDEAHPQPTADIAVLKSVLTRLIREIASSRSEVAELRPEYDFDYSRAKPNRFVNKMTSVGNE